MATVIDELVIHLGLNPGGLITGQQQALQSLRSFVANLHQQSQIIQAQGNAIQNTVARMQTSFLGMSTMALAGAAGLAALVHQIVASDAATAHMSRVLGVNAATLAGWGAAARNSGASAEGVTSAFAGLADQMQQFRFTGQPFEGMRWLNALNIGIQETNGQFKETPKLFSEMANEMTRRGYSLAAQGTMFRQVFGGAAADLLKMKDRADRLGISVDQLRERDQRLANITNATVMENQKLADRWADLELRAGGLGREIERGLIGPLEKLADAFAKSFEKGGLLYNTLEEIKTLSEKGIGGLFEHFWDVPKGNVSGGAVKDFIKKGLSDWADFFSGRSNPLSEMFGIGSAGGATPPAGAPGTGRFPGDFGFGGTGGRTIGGGGGGGANASAAKAAMIDQLRKEGIPEANLDAAASLLLGQAMAESEVNPNAVHDSGTGYGIYGARLERRDAMLKWLRENGYAMNSVEGQARYMAHEPFTSARFAPTVAALRSATRDNAAERSGIIMRNFENPAGNDPRISQTMRALQTGTIPNVATGAGGAAAAWPSNIDNSTNSSTSNSSNTHVQIHSMNVTTPDAEDFARRLQPALTRMGTSAEFNTGLA